jgi:hypothetical protein
MLRPGGYAVIEGGSGTVAAFEFGKMFRITSDKHEADTYACVHCNAQVHAPVRSKDDYFFCRNCMSRICPACADHPCIPFMKKVEAQEEKDRMLRSYVYR